MVGQRVGVRPSRLVRWGILIGLLGLVIAFVGGRYAKDWLVASSTSGIKNSEVALGNPGTGNSFTLKATPLTDTRHPLDDVLKLASEAMAKHKDEHHSYRAIIRKQERIAGELGPESRMELKLRYREEDPETQLQRVDVYLKFLEPKSQAGREVIWQEGINDDLMVVHESGFLNITRIELSPTSRLAMIGNRYPVSDIGIERLLWKLLAKGNRDRKLGDCQVQLYDSINVAGRDCQRIEVCHPEAFVVVDGKRVDHEFFKAIIDIDKEYGVPIRYASYLWPKESGQDPLLDEEFQYEELEFNSMFTDQDFDPDNPAYNYP